jgi:hypothetical protein
MCKVSNKVKFCTCEGRTYKNLEHYWVLHRYDESKTMAYVGETLLPHGLNTPNYNINTATFLARLNETDAFDRLIAFEDNDQLEIVINNLDHTQKMAFGFEYKNKKWSTTFPDSLNLANFYDNITFGSFESLEEK